MMRYLWLAIASMAILLSTNVMAANKDFSFYVDGNDKLCLSLFKLKIFGNAGVDAQREVCSAGYNSIQIRVIDAPEDANFPKGIYLERPFLIIDGINLDPVEKRTLTDLEEDVQQVGLPKMLKNLGYTPILVQFTETVRTSLQENSDVLSRLFAFLNDNKLIPFPGAKDEGFVIMGISQGGVIGRYAAYLYDIHRKATDAPIRIFSSLDSPHQGAVMPKGLFNTVAFWSDEGGSSAAERFKDILMSPGAADLLVYENKCADTYCYSAPKTKGRFLFDDYRKAAEYKGFPTVLIAQGQLKGVSPEHANVYYRLGRHVEKGPFSLGSAISRMCYSDQADGTIAYNRKKEGTDDESRLEYTGTSEYDFIQGSTYPFARTIYKSLREGFLDAIPDNMSSDILFFSISLSTSWIYDELNQDRSTFIPTASAMDMKCNGDLAMRSECGFTQSYQGFPFENPGNRSTATATFAVDPTHPRFNEPISGRHVEMPLSSGTLNVAALEGMQVDMWRILCEVAKYDYDFSLGQFRNPKLVGVFSPNTSCMDLSKIPDIILNAGAVQETPFAYARYDYNAAATERDSAVKFVSPAGWKKVALWDNGGDIQKNTSFEVDVKIENPKGNWMKAELLLCRIKTCRSYLQLNEISVPLDGMTHTLRWQMPQNDGALNGLRWFSLVINSDGADVTISNPHMVLNTRGDVALPLKIESPVIYPYQYDYYTWTDEVHVNPYSDNLGTGLEIKYDRPRRGMHIEIGKMVSMDDYTNLVVDYWPGTCQKTLAYFDSKKLQDENLANGWLQNGFVRKILPLSEIIDQNVTPQGSKSAHRLNLQSVNPNERCVIKSIMLQ
jgi:hypothetical protein